MTLTPAQQKGFKIGKLYRVFKVTEGAEFHQSTGQIVEFYDDDGSYCPEFTDTNSGKSIYIRLEDLQPYNPATPETTLTPAQQKGFKIGKLYRVFKYSPDRTDYQRVGQIVEFTEDDRSDYPIFEDIMSGRNFYIMLDDLEPFEQPAATKQKPSPQEILLMYVRQRYPEDRVMIAMVESL